MNKIQYYTLNDFFNLDLITGTYIVHLKYKYFFENEYTEENEVLDVLCDGTCVWLNDWNEGQNDVLVCWYINVDDIELQEKTKLLTTEV